VRIFDWWQAENGILPHQIPSYHAVLDRIDYVLEPTSGLFGIADFYTAGKELGPVSQPNVEGRKECGWFSRWFWQVRDLEPFTFLLSNTLYLYADMVRF
jgi:hypothetical protein